MYMYKSYRRAHSKMSTVIPVFFFTFSTKAAILDHHLSAWQVLKKSVCENILGVDVTHILKSVIFDKTLLMILVISDISLSACAMKMMLGQRSPTTTPNRIVTTGIKRPLCVQASQSIRRRYFHKNWGDIIRSNKRSQLTANYTLISCFTENNFATDHASRLLGKT